MKKQSLYNSLLIVLLFLAACKKTVNEPEVDYVQFEGKAYVIGSNLPPKGLPLKLILYKDTNIIGTKTLVAIDTFYTDNKGNFKYSFRPYKRPDGFYLKSLNFNMYETLDYINTNKFGIFKKDIRFIAFVPFTLELENSNFTTNDSLYLTDPSGQSLLYIYPININRILELRYWAYDTLDFRFRLKRNEIDSSWSNKFYCVEDSIYYHKIIF